MRLADSNLRMYNKHTQRSRMTEDRPEATHMTRSTRGPLSPTKAPIVRSLTNTLVYCSRRLLLTSAVVGMVLFSYGRFSTGAEGVPVVPPEGPELQPSAAMGSCGPTCSKPPMCC
jgi:hypothetical protein